MDFGVVSTFTPTCENNPIHSIDPFGLYNSPTWLSWVPGQHNWDRSLTAFEQGQYGWGTAYIAAMLGEQVLFALTLGEYGMAKAAGQCVSTANVPKSVIGFAEGTGKTAFTPNRLQHASRHLIDDGILPNWSKVTGQKFTDLGSKILETPAATFDHILKGGQPVKGFIGKINGKDVAIMVYKKGRLKGQIATSVVPSPAQLTKWRVTP